MFGPAASVVIAPQFNAQWRDLPGERKSLDYSVESSEALALLVGRGNRAAATVLIERHTDKIYAQCFRFLRNQAAAEDAVQETFIRLWLHAKSWKSNGARFESWLYRIAANYCLDQLRKAGREVGDEALTLITDGGAGPADIVAANQRHELIVKALNELPDRQRMAIALCYLQEHSNVEAAEIMEISLPAIESLLARARRQLREIMTPAKPAFMEDIRDDAVKVSI